MPTTAPTSQPTVTANALAVVCIMFFLALPSPAGAEETHWWPIQVKSHYGTYDAAQKVPGHPSPSLGRPRLEEWSPPEPGKKRYTLGVSFPHLKDPYWVAVNYGIIQEARRLGMGIRLVEAGGYGHLEEQQNQVRMLARQGVDGIILGSISYHGNDGLIADMTRQGFPVVEVINDVRSQDVSAKALVSFYEMGYYAGEFVARHAEKANLHTVRISFFPGPEESGWAPETLQGFLEAMHHFPGEVILADTEWGDTGMDDQRMLLQKSLERTGPVDYIVGNAMAAKVAPDVLAKHNMTETRVVSTYITPSLYDEIVAGRVIAAPSDLTVFQGRMAVDMLVRNLNGEEPGRDFPFRSGPFIPMITPENVNRYPYEGLFGPRDYEPVFQLKEQE